MSILIRKILAPTDLTEFGNAAVETAAGFARALEAKLVLLHVVDLPTYPGFLLEGEGHSPDQMAVKFAEKQLSTIKSDQLLQGLEVEIRVKTGKIFRAITSEAKQSEIDLIVMGAHGLTGFEQVMLGTNARRVIHSTDIPVLTVKQPLRFEDIHTIAIASNFNQEYAYSFSRLYQYTEMFKADLKLIKVITPQNFETSAFSLKTVEDFASSLNLSDYQVHFVNANSVEEGLSWICERNRIDLLFMPTHDQSGLSRLGPGVLLNGWDNNLPFLFSATV